VHPSLPSPSRSPDGPAPIRTPVARRLRRAPTLRGDAGFTLVEMLVAMVVLLVGVLGVATMALAAMDAGAGSRTREAATNLGREVVESLRSAPYEALLTSTAPSVLREMDGLGDAAPTDDGWQVQRRDVAFTVEVEGCVYDDPKDGSFSGNAAPGYCAGAAPGSADPNGDDHRKVDVVVRWGTREVSLTATVANPAGGFGPRITGLTSVPGVSGTSVVAADGVTSVALTVLTTPAATLRWDAGDAKSRGQLVGSGATSWPFSWPLGVPADAAAFSCGTAIDWVLDAPGYQLTAQPLDSSGLPGDLRTQTIAVDRVVPYRACDFAGGRNPRHGGVVDLQWRPSPEGDVVSYSVWRVKQGAEATDRLVCDAVRVAECADTSPPATTDGLEYSVRAQQDNVALARAFGAPAAHGIPAATTPDVPPTAPGDVAVVVEGQPTISWSASSDPDGSVIFYRVYRDGEELADRYGKTSNGATLTFTDKDAGDVPHTYSVTAVDDTFAESPLVPAS
jgi:prepilin-type N-terminal cleavage/methylation domain-containing protein